MAEAPEWLVALVEEKPAQTTPSPQPGTPLDSGIPLESGAPLAHIQEIIPEGQRDDTLFRKACAYRGMGLDHDEIWILLQVWNLHYCVPPLADEHITKIVRVMIKSCG